MDLFGIVFHILRRVVADVFFIWTGEAVLWVVTLGRHAPQWDRGFQSDALELEILSFWVGSLFWIGVGVALFFYLT